MGVVALLVGVDGVRDRVALAGEVQGDEVLDRADTVLRVELAGQGHHDLLRGTRVHAPLRCLDRVEQALFHSSGAPAGSIVPTCSTRSLRPYP